MTSGTGWTVVGATAAISLALLAVVFLSMVSGIRSSSGLPRNRRLLLFGLRLAGLLLLSAAILRPARLDDITRLRKPPLIFMLDTSQSMVYGGTNTGRSLVEALSAHKGRITRLQEYYRIDYVGLGSPPPVINPADLKEAFPFTVEESPLRETLEHLARTRKDLAGLVLMSDGQDTLSPDNPPQALPFPVYSVTGQETSVRDLRIDEVNTPPVAFVRTPVTIRVLLGSSGYPSQSATVTLMEEGRFMASQSATTKDGRAEVQLSFTPRRTGRWAYTLEVSPWAGESVLENNRARFSLRVIRDKTRVLLVSGTPTWDVKFLRRRLKQDPGVDLITFLILRTPQDLNLVPQNEMSLIPFPTKELFSEELPSFDAVIFANFNYGPYVPVQYLENLVKFVRDDGGGFVMLGGDRSFALGGYAGTPLEQILPAEITGAAPGTEYQSLDFRPRLTRTGESHPIMQWKSTLQENRSYWNSLPRMRGLNWLLRAKTGGLVLAESPEQRNEYGPMPFIVTGEFGSGRSLLVASDNLWKWGLPNAGAGGDSAAYRDFWTRALKWLVHDPDMELVRLAIPPEPVRAGRPLRFEARVLDRHYAPASGATLEGYASGGAGHKKIALSWTGTNPGEYRTAPVMLPSPGSWRVEVSGRLGDTLLGKDGLGFAVLPETDELMKLGINRPYLDRLSQSSGGRTLALNEMDTLLDHLEALGRADREVVGRKLDEIWPVWSLLLLSLLVLGLDWGLRRFWK